MRDDCLGAAGGRGLAELAPATAALFSNLLSLVVRPAISEAGAGATATLFSNLSSLATTSADSEAGAAATAALFSNLSSLATTSADSEAGVAGKAALFSSLSSLAAISANRDEESWSTRSLSLSKRAPYSCSIWSSRTVSCVSAALRSRIADRSSPRPLWPVIAPRSALRTSAAEERPAIAWLFVVGNVQFRGEPQIADTPKMGRDIKPVPRKSGLRRRDFALSA